MAYDSLFGISLFKSSITDLKCCVSSRCAEQWFIYIYIYTHTHTHTHMYMYICILFQHRLSLYSLITNKGEHFFMLIGHMYFLTWNASSILCHFLRDLFSSICRHFYVFVYIHYSPLLFHSPLNIREWITGAPSACGETS